MNFPRVRGKFTWEDFTLNTAILTALILAAAFFYLVFPGVGAFFVRSHWRAFRKAVVDASAYPEITYKDLRTRGADSAGGETHGPYYFLGVLEAIQEDDIIWLRNEEITLSADMKGQRVFLLPSQTVSGGGGDDASFLSDQTPSALAWEKVRSLPEGIQVLLAGSLRISRGKGRFVSGEKSGLLVLFYDGDNESLLKRAVWHGRQRNEYWNLFTGVSLGAGFLTGMILSYFFLSPPINRMPAILSIMMSLVPLVPLLPPGLIFYGLYRRLWRRGRFLRAERDILKLPQRSFVRGEAPDGAASPEKTALAAKCEKEAVRREILSLVMFSLGFLGNLYLVLWGLAALIQ